MQKSSEYKPFINSGMGKVVRVSSVDRYPLSHVDPHNSLADAELSVLSDIAGCRRRLMNENSQLDAPEEGSYYLTQVFPGFSDEEIPHWLRIELNTAFLDRYIKTTEIKIEKIRAAHSGDKLALQLLMVRNEMRSIISSPEKLISFSREAIGLYMNNFSSIIKLLEIATKR